MDELAALGVDLIQADFSDAAGVNHFSKYITSNYQQVRAVIHNASDWLPESSGLDVCRQIRAESDVPIIMLTARDSEADKVAGLELGADDYVTKPFSMRELMARIRAQVRRSMRTGTFADTNEVLRGGGVELDMDAHVARVNGSEVDLRPKEFDLLESLMRRKNRLASREALIDEVWGPHYYGDTKTLDVHIKRLRQKLEFDPSKPQVIVTVRGLGYKFVDG